MATSSSSILANPHYMQSQLYEDYIHFVPRRHYTLREHLMPMKRKYEEGTKLFWRRFFGKRSGNEGFDMVLEGDHLEREDIVTRNKVSQLTEEERAKACQRGLKTLSNIGSENDRPVFDGSLSQCPNLLGHDKNGPRQQECHDRVGSDHPE